MCSHNIEKVMYFLLLKRKAEHPTVEDSDYGLDDDDDEGRKCLFVCLVFVLFACLCICVCSL